ncbi:TspO/MBR family protein [Mesorhizobium sp. KR9-304]|uniref:TspO/MBR family protein n=1 Tax=Mesorhizobium sp. KR9-304 TaxID=3156614 RepID=UPI0032B38CE9
MDASSLLMTIAFGAASFGAAATGAIFRPGDWYRRLDKPPWRPPNWLFAPVWTMLYASIAVSGWLVWRAAGIEGAALPLAVFALQLLLNAAWTPLFFGLRRPDLALVEIVMLWGSIAATIVLFYPVSATAAWLLVPYLAWVSFASALNASIWRRNRPSAAAGGVR